MNYEKNDSTKLTPYPSVYRTSSA